MADSICRKCFHSYVCEQFNRYRDSENNRCHFYNDHFVPYSSVMEICPGDFRIIERRGFEDVVKVVRCKDCKNWGLGQWCETFDHKHEPDFYCFYGERKGDDAAD